MTSERPLFPFLRVHDASGSQMAASLARLFAGDRIVILSAGAARGERFRPAAVEGVREKSAGVTARMPQATRGATGLSPDDVILGGSGNAYPLISGDPYLDGRVLDPTHESLDQVRHVGDDVEQRVTSLRDESLTPHNREDHHHA